MTGREVPALCSQHTILHPCCCPLRSQHPAATSDIQRHPPTCLPPPNKHPRLPIPNQDLRKARKAEEQQQKAEDAKQWRERSLQEGRKKVGKAAAAQQQQRHKGGKAAPVPPGDAAAAGGQQQQQQGGKGGGKGGKRQREEDSLAFNKLDFGSGGLRVGWGKRGGAVEEQKGSAKVPCHCQPLGLNAMTAQHRVVPCLCLTPAPLPLTAPPVTRPAAAEEAAAQGLQGAAARDGYRQGGGCR